MAFVIDESLEIDAPRAVVWEVLTDFPRYGEWNPFVIGCASSLVVGEPIDMRVQIFAAFAQPQRETIFEHVPDERFAYGVANAPLGAVRSRRSHALTAIAPERTGYHSHFELDGWAAPLTRALLGSRLEAGFAAMTQAVKQRAESLAQGRRAEEG